MMKTMQTLSKPKNRNMVGWVWVGLMAVLVTTLALYGVRTHLATYYDRLFQTQTQERAETEAVLYADQDGIVQSISPEAERLTGWSAADLTGKPIEALMTPDRREQHRETFNSSTMQTGDVRVITCEVTLADGPARVTLFMTRYSTPQGHYAYAVTIYPADAVKVHPTAQH